MKRLVWIAITVVTLLLIVGGAMASQFNLSALPEPDKMETFIASKAKHYLVRRASRVGIPPALTDMQPSITEGDKLFGTECSECHGDNGRRPTDAGRWMYPRAADLSSVEVQNYSDRELGQGNHALKTRSIEVLMFSLCLLALGCGSDKSSSPRPARLTGPNVGQKMPPFTARDQFGEDVSSDTLKGTNGTVLLFFRSADW